MLRIIYNSRVGLVVPDGLVEETVQDLIQQHRVGKTSVVAVASDLFVAAFRLAILNDQLHHEEVEFQFDTTILQADTYGKLPAFPYDDVSCSYAIALITGTTKKKQRLAAIE